MQKVSFDYFPRLSIQEYHGRFHIVYFHWSCASPAAAVKMHTKRCLHRKMFTKTIKSPWLGYADILCCGIMGGSAQGILVMSSHPHFLLFSCHLLFVAGWIVVPLCDSTKSVTTTCVSPSFFTHLPTVLRTCSNRRSKASRCASVKTGVRGSRDRDSRITSLRRYSDLAKSFSLSSVERLML